MLLGGITFPPPVQSNYIFLQLGDAQQCASVIKNDETVKLKEDGSCVMVDFRWRRALLCALMQADSRPRPLLQEKTL